MLPMLKYEVSICSSAGTRSIPRCSILSLPANRCIFAYRELPYSKLSPCTAPSLVLSNGMPSTVGDFSISRSILVIIVSDGGRFNRLRQFLVGRILEEPAKPNDRTELKTQKTQTRQKSHCEIPFFYMFLEPDTGVDFFDSAP